MNFVFPFGVIFLWVLVLPLYWHPLKTPFPLFHLWVTKKDGSLYKFLLNLVLEENNHGIEKVRSTKAVWIIKWLLSCLEGPALFHMLPWDSYSKEVEQLQTFCWNLIPSFWPVHRRKVFFFSHIPWCRSFLPNTWMIKNKKVRFPVLSPTPLPFLFVWLQFSERHTYSPGDCWWKISVFRWGTAFSASV